MTFKHLGANIASNGSLKKEVQVQTTEAATMSTLPERYNPEERVRELKIRIDETCVRPVTTTPLKQERKRSSSNEQRKRGGASLATFCGIESATAGFKMS